MRPDLIGEAYASALAQLQDRVPPFDSAEAFAIIESELGAPVSELFSEITAQPIASASLGQVGSARASGAGCGCSAAARPLLVWVAAGARAPRLGAAAPPRPRPAD